MLHVLAAHEARVQHLATFSAAHLLDVRPESPRAVVVLRAVKQKQLHADERFARNTLGRTPCRAFRPLRKDLAGFVREACLLAARPLAYLAHQRDVILA
ncbi:hypothetical protein WMF39_17760 [Sorangium sp. So ce1504]|uniref:hypothetical protein n=1 Tax=Sorangium sp. So ce1504 TaxID=3133337 RepID=UPI003F5F8BE1